MSTHPIIGLLIISCIFLTGIELYMRRYNDISAAHRFRLILWLAFFWTFIYAANLSTTDMPLKFVLAQFQMIPVILMPPAILVFVLDYTGNLQWLTPKNITMILFVPVFALAGLLLDPEHSTLFRYNFQLDLSGPLPLLISDKGVLFWIYVVYSYVLLLAAIWLLFTSPRKNKTLHPGKSSLIAVGFMIPFLVNALYTVGITPIHGLDLAPIAFIVSGIVYLWAIRDFKIFEISPIARHAVMDNITDMVFILDKSGRITDLNRAAQDACHISDPEIGINTETLPDPWAGFFQSYADVSYCKTEVSLSMDGSPVYYELSISPIQEQGNRVIGRLFIMHDVTENKQIEIALKESEISARSLIENMTDVVVRYDADLHYTYISPSIQRFFEVNPEEMVGKAYHEVGFIKNLEMIKEETLKKVRTTKQPMDVEFDYSIDGKQYFLETRVYPEFDSENNLKSLVSITRDVTKRKQSELALSASEERYRTLVETAPISIVQTRNNKVIYANPAAQKMGGYLVEEMVGSNPLEYIAPGSQPHLDDQAAGQANTLHYELDLKRKDGSIATVWVARTQINLAGEEPSYIRFIQDITERKHFEKKLQESEKRYRLLAENIMDVIWVVDMETSKFTYVSPSVERLRGYTPEEVMAQDMSASLTPESFSRLQSALPPQVEKFLSGEELPEYDVNEVQQPCKDGSTVWTETTTKFFLNPDTGHLEVYGVSRDITRRKQVEESLRQSELTARTLIELPATTILLLDLDGRIIDCNQKVAQNLGLTRNEMIGKIIWDFLPEDVATIRRNHFVEMIQSGQTRRWIDNRGSRWFDNVFTPVTNENGKITQVVGFAYEISDRKLAEEALRLSEERFSKAFRTSPAGMVISRRDTAEILDVNDKFCEITGYDREELLGNTTVKMNLWTNPDDRASLVQTMQRDGHVYGFETIAKIKNGNLRNFLISMEKIELHDAPCFITFGLDITNLKDLQRQERELAALETRQALARDLHDAVSQTLFSARLTAEMLVSQKENITSEELWKSIEHFNELVVSALGEMRILLLELRPEGMVNTELPFLLGHLVDAARSRTDAKITLKTKSTAKLPLDVKIAFYRIAQESLNNIAKHANATQVSITLTPENSGVKLCITDNGSGFTTGQNTSDHFGLEIMRERADEIGANLEVVSHPQQGTRVTCFWRNGKSND